ncbi:hypothetical protein ACFZAD_30865 [Streptomyces iakyrus]|uniref:hypothetical protein n=1 Tax=Streptomyces iakyrus TaxID=68219 RepID=UPI0036F0BF00
MMVLLGLLATMVIILASGITMYVTYQHPALAEPLTVAVGVAAVLLTGIALTRR